LAAVRLVASRVPFSLALFPPPWTVEQIPGGFKVVDANGQSLAYVYGRESKANADSPCAHNGGAKGCRQHRQASKLPGR
jgi:hypothetical protein